MLPCQRNVVKSVYTQNNDIHKANRHIKHYLIVARALKYVNKNLQRTTCDSLDSTKCKLRRAVL